jgi:integrase
MIPFTPNAYISSTLEWLPRLGRFSYIAFPSTKKWSKVIIFPALSANAVTIGFGRLAKALRLSNFKFHDLRHDVASTLTMAGVPQRTVMEILGHKDPRMTLRYQHLSPDHLRKAITALEYNGHDGLVQQHASGIIG